MSTMETTSAKPLRSDFLTIICVLTFIGSGIGILSGINNYREADLTSALMRDQLQKSKAEVKDNAKTREAKEGANVAESMINSALAVTSPERVKQQSIFNGICNLFTLLGGILMFRLKRLGFWIYLLGTLGLIVMPVLIYGTGNFFSWGMSGVYGIIGLIFVVMYYRNLKYMN